MLASYLKKSFIAKQRERQQEIEIDRERERDVVVPFSFTLEFIIIAKLVLKPDLVFKFFGKMFDMRSIGLSPGWKMTFS